MILGAFGDSFIFGSELSDIQDRGSTEFYLPSKLTYPALIAKKLDFDYYCTALPGQGNKVIADDVIRAVQYNGNSMFYLINWSWIDRFEYLGEAKVGFATGWESTLPGASDSKSTYYYKNFYSDIDAKLSNLMYINTTINCLVENKCKFLITYMDHLLFDKQWHCPVSVDYLQNKIQKHTTSFKGKTFLEWAHENQYPVSDHCHPLELAHENAAEYWLPMVQLINNQAKEDYLHAFK